MSESSKVICSKSAVRETQRKLMEKLKLIDLNQLKRVSTFAKGHYAHVSLVQLDGHPTSAFALKTIRKSKIKSPGARRNVLSEKELLSEVQSDFVVKFYKTLKDKKSLNFLTEYCPGGNLHRRGRFPEHVAKFYIACTVEAIDCLHSQDIIHNDIKPENLVLDDEGYAKLIDLGLAEKIERDQVTYSIRGTLLFMPPEVSWAVYLKEKKCLVGRDRSVDLWALGVLLYTFLTGQTPFQNKFGDTGKTCMSIINGIDAVPFPKTLFSTEAKDLVRKLCASEYPERLGYESIQEIRSHRWFDKFDWLGLRNREMKPPVLPKVESAIDTRNFKVKVTPVSDGEDDESDWDMEF